MKVFFLLLFLCFTSISCAYQNYKWIKVNGREIKTPYGKADADMFYESKLCFPNCSESLTNSTNPQRQKENGNEKDNTAGNLTVGD